jgi:hypothetical protein
MPPHVRQRQLLEYPLQPWEPQSWVLQPQEHLPLQLEQEHPRLEGSGIGLECRNVFLFGSNESHGSTNGTVFTFTSNNGCQEAIFKCFH